jgi:hypothetical protein
MKRADVNIKPAHFVGAKQVAENHVFAS